MQEIGKKLIVLTVSVGLLLLVPLVAMRFTDELAWALTDFVASAILLFGAGLTYVLLARNANRLLVALAITAVLVLVWAELAVGVFGTPWGGS